MLLNIINEARRDFEKHCAETHQSNSAGCLSFLNKAVTAVQEGDDLPLVVARTFESRKGFKDISEWLDWRGCSNPREYKRLMIKGFYALTMLNPTEKQRKTLGGLVAAYDTEWPKAKGNASKAKKDTVETVKLTVPALMELVMEFGLSKAEAVKFLAKARKMAA